MQYRFSTLMTRCVFPVIAVLSLIGISSTAQAAGYIKFDGVEGESKKPRRDGWSDLLSFSEAVQATSSKSRSSASSRTIKVEMPLDSATNGLYDAAVQGTRIREVIIDHCGSNPSSGEEECRLDYLLTNVLITDYETADDEIRMVIIYESAIRQYSPYTP